MPNYTLHLVGDLKTLSTVAADQQQAIDHFARELGTKLSLEDDGSVAPYLLDEWTGPAHWSNPTIPVYGLAGGDISGG